MFIPDDPQQHQMRSRRGYLKTLHNKRNYTLYLITAPECHQSHWKNIHTRLLFSSTLLFTCIPMKKCVAFEPHVSFSYLWLRQSDLIRTCFPGVNCQCCMKLLPLSGPVKRRCSFFVSTFFLNPRQKSPNVDISAHRVCSIAQKPLSLTVFLAAVIY